MVCGNLADDYGSLGDSTSQYDVQSYGGYPPTAGHYGRPERTLTIHNHYGEPPNGMWPRPDGNGPASSRTNTVAAGVAGGVAGALTTLLLLKWLNSDS